MSIDPGGHEHVVTEHVLWVIVGVDDGVHPGEPHGCNLRLPRLAVSGEHGSIHQHGSSLAHDQATIAACVSGFHVDTISELDHRGWSPLSLDRCSSLTKLFAPSSTEPTRSAGTPPP